MHGDRQCDGMVSRGAENGVGCARETDEPPTIDPRPLVQTLDELRHFIGENGRGMESLDIQ
jgi:hypothetical protein